MDEAKDSGFFSNLRVYCIHENFRWIKISPGPATFVLQKKCRQKYFFANAVKVAISPMQCLTLDKNLALMKFLPTRAGGEIGEISPGKIFLHVHRAGGAGPVGQAKTGPLRLVG